MRSRLLLPWVIVVAIVIVFEVVGRQLGFLSIPSLGYDKMLHFLAGGACGIFGIATLKSITLLEVEVLNFSHDTEDYNQRVWLFAITSAIVIGVLWEVAQVYLPFMRDASDLNWYDTVGDMVFDTIGGAIAGLAYQEKE
ncbi:MAG TPA: hypothetical protein VJJ02_05405 [Candidatus Paceibacterota bacterium]